MIAELCAALEEVQSKVHCLCLPATAGRSKRYRDSDDDDEDDEREHSDDDAPRAAAVAPRKRAPAAPSKPSASHKPRQQSAKQRVVEDDDDGDDERGGDDVENSELHMRMLQAHMQQQLRNGLYHPGMMRTQCVAAVAGVAAGLRLRCLRVCVHAMQRQGWKCCRGCSKHSC